jgi:hypothetical protein
LTCSSSPVSAVAAVVRLVSDGRNRYSICVNQRLTSRSLLEARGVINVSCDWYPPVHDI